MYQDDFIEWEQLQKSIKELPDPNNCCHTHYQFIVANLQPRPVLIGEADIKDTEKIFKITAERISFFNKNHNRVYKWKITTEFVV